MKNTYIIYICAALAFLPLSAVPAAAQSLSLEDCLRMASENDPYLRNAASTPVLRSCGNRRPFVNISLPSASTPWASMPSIRCCA